MTEFIAVIASIIIPLLFLIPFGLEFTDLESYQTLILYCVVIALGMLTTMGETDDNR